MNQYLFQLCSAIHGLHSTYQRKSRLSPSRHICRGRCVLDMRSSVDSVAGCRWRAVRVPALVNFPNVKHRVTLVMRIPMLRWPSFSFHIAGDYRKGRSKAKLDCLMASMVAFRRKSPLRPCHSSHLTSRHIMKKDVEANS